MNPKTTTQVIKTAKTRNSTYEINLNTQQIRLVESKNPPFRTFAPLGEWKPYHSFALYGGCLHVEWNAEGIDTTSTSAILEMF